MAQTKQMGCIASRKSDLAQFLSETFLPDCRQELGERPVLTPLDDVLKILLYQCEMLLRIDARLDVLEQQSSI
ncbi:hypothetical protein ASE61_11800 [Bosea sp. Root670]|nr:hypothetical protein ASE61_11800 [Bosea sp. Root670]